jgi:glutamyl-Q tRNA(Asp) synthetase
LYTAAASFLDARAAGGRWLVRIEDLDGPRVVPGSADAMLRTLSGFGFEWDGEIVRQSERTAGYLAALDELELRGLTFPCSCSRAQLADEDRYPGHCRSGPRVPGAAMATRLRIDPLTVQFTDRIQGTFRQDLAAAVGDLLLRRRDRLVAYLLAVVVDDAAQGVTHVVRGADLLDNTPRQIHLQRVLGFATPGYAHVPVLMEPDGRKLAKSARSVRADPSSAVAQLVKIFTLLNMSPPPDLCNAALAAAWAWGISHWKIQCVPKRLMHRLGPQNA